MGLNLKQALNDLAETYDVPSITTWKMGRFVDSKSYDRMGMEWKAEQMIREASLIRPGGGTNNAIFRVEGNEEPSTITMYLEALGELLEKVEREGLK